MTITRDQIQLRPRAMRNGYVVRGDREIWIAGEHWLTAIGQHHGTHGTSYSLEYPNGHELSFKVSKEGRPDRFEAPRVRSYKSRRQDAVAKRQSADSVLNTYDAIAQLAADLFNAGKLESPAARAARVEANRQRIAEARTKEVAHRETMLFHLNEMYGAANVVEREALRWIYKEAFATAPKEWKE